MAFRAVNFFFHTFHPFPTTPETENRHQQKHDKKQTNIRKEVFPSLSWFVHLFLTVFT
jgi:hypothetical protein